MYLEALEERILACELEAVRISGPSLLRSVDPPVSEACGKRVVSLGRVGKRIVIGVEGDLFLVIHLMVAGRFRWVKRGAVLPRKLGLAAFDFDSGTLLLTEASGKKRASLHVVRGAAGVAAHDPGGIEVFDSDARAFRDRLVAENRTLKRALTDPRIFAGIGNAYSDEILHRARLSPVTRTRSLDDEQIARLYEAVRGTLSDWTERLRAEAGADFPERVTAFREGMAVHGRHKQPCPTCAAPVQRIVYAANETHYCARCQTGGKLLADRALSRLLKEDWPRSLEELEARTKAI